MSENGRTLGLMAAGLAVPTILVLMWMGSAKKSLAESTSAASEVAIAQASDDTYCTPALKQILRRVAGACGLLQEGGRGCKPGDAKAVAAMNGDDFNALFLPLKERVKIVQFDPEQTTLDDGAMRVVEQAWGDQKGASFFFVVARASPDGAADANQQLSQSRAESVLTHLQNKFRDPDLKNEVGLLWLGEEYAQLSGDFCNWQRSRDGECTQKEINRSAFVAWIDCAI
jgi:outer membrane protein OmpA-like peptidoglycan-associated protein